MRAKGKGQSAESETPADRLGCSGRRRAAFGYFRAPVQRRAGASELQKAVSKRARHGAACGRRRKIEVGAWSSAGLRAACVPRSPTPGFSMPNGAFARVPAPAPAAHAVRAGATHVYCISAKDHPYTPPEERIPIPLKLRTAEEYIAMDGEIVNAAEDAFRTHASDPDPVAATFSQMLSEEECAEIIRLAAPKMTRAGVTTDDGKGGRQSAGRTNDSCWLPHDTSPQVRAPAINCSPH